MTFRVPEQYRDAKHEWRLGGDCTGELFGAFSIPSPLRQGRRLLVIASNGEGWASLAEGVEWEHVSVSCLRKGRVIVPTWAEMCFVKGLFWEPEDCVMQLHPPESDYISMTEALHLWRPRGADIPMPPKVMV